MRNEGRGQFWLRYFPQLLGLACKHLDPRIRRREDEEDILQSMYKSFCIRLQHGDYAFKDRTDLWRLLVTMTLHKTRNVAVRQKRVRRDYRRERPAVLSDDSSSPEEAFAWMEQAGPTPAEAAVLTEELERRLNILPAPLRQIALWKLEGFTNEEIAKEKLLNRTERTVERKLALIREKWLSMD